MRDDPRAGLELGEQARPQLHIEIRQQVERHHRRLAELGAEQILVAELDQLGDAVLLRVLLRLLDALRVDVDADRADAEFLGRHHRNAAVARAEVVEHVALLHPGELQHLVDYLVGGRHIDHVRCLGARRGLRESLDGKKSCQKEKPGKHVNLPQWSCCRSGSSRWSGRCAPARRRRPRRRP